MCAVVPAQNVWPGLRILVKGSRRNSFTVAAMPGDILNRVLLLMRFTSEWMAPVCVKQPSGFFTPRKNAPPALLFFQRVWWIHVSPKFTFLIVSGRFSRFLLQIFAWKCEMGINKWLMWMNFLLLAWFMHSEGLRAMVEAQWCEISTTWSFAGRIPGRIAVS